jgi:hypothetical protein
LRAEDLSFLERIGANGNIFSRSSTKFRPSKIEARKVELELTLASPTWSRR